MVMLVITLAGGEGEVCWVFVSVLIHVTTAFMICERDWLKLSSAFTLKVMRVDM